MTSLMAAVLALSTMSGAASAGAADRAQPAFNGVFELAATHGYGIFGIVSSSEAVGTATLIVSDGRGSAVYNARGAGTADSIDVGFGELGKVDVEFRPTGAMERIRTGCDGRGEAISIPAYEFDGTIEFHGEEGFAEASTTRTPVRFGTLLHLFCGGLSSGEGSGEGLRGVAVTARAAAGPSLRLQQNHPGAPVSYEANERETRGAVRIERTVGGRLGAGALRYDPTLSTASFAAASPFTGAATYVQRMPPHEVRPGRGAWRGSLRVDFPGDAGARLAGPGFKASIIHAQRTESHQ